MPESAASAHTVAQALARGSGMSLQRLDVQLLLLQALGRSDAGRAWLLAHDTDPVPDAPMQAFVQLCRRRADGEPLAYLVGIKEFFGLSLHVDPRVLVPRPDTETLVEWALQTLAGLAPAPRVLDLGTGSGAIALAIQHARPDARVTAIDASAQALAVAQANAQRLGLPVAFRHGSWLQGQNEIWDLIVSNPPYVAEGDPHLAALTHEPRTALVATGLGLDDLRSIIEQAPPHLAPGGRLLLEHGHDQAGAVRALLAAHGFSDVSSRKDLAGIERCSGGIRPAQR
ncbi:MAG: peptide chain release factor N(5)-glutamine methyltransferase [Burkholderiaceae bacterium]|nr:peptide chain release factor N(5)-glutamine methyltransferase [Burkholderiaceae bacterium]